MIYIPNLMFSVWVSCIAAFEKPLPVLFICIYEVHLILDSEQVKVFISNPWAIWLKSFDLGILMKTTAAVWGKYRNQQCWLMIWNSYSGFSYLYITLVGLRQNCLLFLSPLQIRYSFALKVFFSFFTAGRGCCWIYKGYGSWCWEGQLHQFISPGAAGPWCCSSCSYPSCSVDRPTG